MDDDGLNCRGSWLAACMHAGCRDLMQVSHGGAGDDRINLLTCSLSSLSSCKSVSVITSFPYVLCLLHLQRGSFSFSPQTGVEVSEVLCLCFCMRCTCPPPPPTNYNLNSSINRELADHAVQSEPEALPGAQESGRACECAAMFCSRQMVGGGNESTATVGYNRYSVSSSPVAVTSL